MSAALTRILKTRPRSQQSDYQRRIADSLKASEWCFYGLVALVALGAVLKAAGVL